jgi:ADP-ribose pyrophosphatase
MSDALSNPPLFVCEKFIVEARQVRRHSGGVKQREVVVHPGAVTVLPVMDDGRIVMIRNQRVAAGRELIELPAGTLEPPEPPIDCARRELIEETGYRAGTIQPICEYFTSPGICTEYMHAFVAGGLVHVGQRLQDAEHIIVEPMTMSQVLAMIREGEIADAKTIATVLYYQVFKAGAHD